MKLELFIVQILLLAI